MDGGSVQILEQIFEKKNKFNTCILAFLTDIPLQCTHQYLLKNDKGTSSIVNPSILPEFPAAVSPAKPIKVAD